MASGVRDPVVDAVLDIQALERAWHGADPGDRPAPRSIKGAQLTITRNTPNDFQDRQVYVFVDEEPWGKIRYGQPITRTHRPQRPQAQRHRAFFGLALVPISSL